MDHVVEGTESILQKRSVRLCSPILPVQLGNSKKIGIQQRSEERSVTGTVGGQQRDVLCILILLKTFA
ncbi:hypothetical protein M3629_18380 [Paenibacillus polysaccharolyticus]|nr:hypothetical protein [Paenibacillus polysaccharolyticus]